MLTDRIEKIRTILSEKKVNQLLVTNPLNIFYITGFIGLSNTEREGLCVISEKKITLIVPRLYEFEAKHMSKLFNLDIIVSNNRHHIFTPLQKLFHSKETIAVESDDLKLSEYDNLKSIFSCKIIKTSGLIERIRIQKDISEVASIKKAVDITDMAFSLIKKEIKIGLTENYLSNKFTEILIGLGAEGSAFSPIVAAGKNSSLPHYVTSDKKIGKGILLIDAGAKYKGYCGDLTRTYYLGSPSEKYVKIYKLVLDAQKRAIASLKAGISEDIPWKKAYNTLGIYKNYFIHGLGHGVGLAIHEEPYLRKGRINKLFSNSTITIEPGIYIPNWGGIRIEDFILLSDSNPIVLSKTPRNIEETIIN